MSASPTTQSDAHQPAAPQSEALAARESRTGAMLGKAVRRASQAQATARQASRALFRIDPGWPFVITGLGLIIAGTLIPAQRDLHELRNSLEEHRAMYEHSERRLAAYDALTTSLEQHDVQLVERLAASQLNRMPADERPLIMLPSMNATIGQWIDDSEPLVLPATAPYPDTLLARLATGPRRLWILASGVFLIFVGLVFGPTAVMPRRRVTTAAAAPAGGASIAAPIADFVPISRDELAVAVTEVDADASNNEFEVCRENSVDAVSVCAATPSSEVVAEEVVAEEVVAEEVVAEEVVAEEVVAEEVVAEEVVAEEVVAEEVVAEEVVAEEVVAEEVVAEEVVAEEVVAEEASTDEPDAEPAVQTEIRAESVLIPLEQELDHEAAWPNARDESLDTLSLFHGIDASKWIDTSDVSPSRTAPSSGSDDAPTLGS